MWVPLNYQIQLKVNMEANQSSRECSAADAALKIPSDTIVALEQLNLQVQVSSRKLKT